MPAVSAVDRHGWIAACLSDRAIALIAKRRTSKNVCSLSGDILVSGLSCKDKDSGISPPLRWAFSRWGMIYAAAPPAASCVSLAHHALQADPPIALLEHTVQQAFFSKAFALSKKSADRFHPVQEIVSQRRFAVLLHFFLRYNQMRFSYLIG